MEPPLSVETPTTDALASASSGQIVVPKRTFGLLLFCKSGLGVIHLLIDSQSNATCRLYTIATNDIEHAIREQLVRPIPRGSRLLHARASAPQAPKANGGAVRRLASLRDRVAAARAPDAGLRPHVPRVGHHL